MNNAISPESLRVSIVVTAFNADQTVERTLDALCGTAWENLEIIVVDDGSTDRTGEILEAMSKRDRRIHVFRHPRNLGTFHARLTGIGNCHGDYVGFVDADDVIDGGVYQGLAEKADVARADILIFGIYRRNTDGKEQVRVSFPREIAYDSGLLEKFVRLEFGTGSMCNKVYRRAVLEEPRFANVTKRLVLNEDYLYNVSCFSRAKRVLVVPEILYHYIQVENSQSSSNHGARAFVSLYENFADALEIFQGEDERVLNAIVELYRHQLQMDYCRVKSSEELLEYRPRLAEAVGRISRIKPEFVNDFFHRPRQMKGLRTGVRLFWAKVKRKCRL